MPEMDPEYATRERTYFLWEAEGGLRAAPSITGSAADEMLLDEEKVLEGRSDANIPAMLTKDVMGG